MKVYIETITIREGEKQLPKETRCSKANPYKKRSNKGKWIITEQ
jgi:hypothetical protein